MITEDQLALIIPNAVYKTKYWHKELIDLLPQYEINTDVRIVSFLAQTWYETNGYRKIKNGLLPLNEKYNHTAFAKNAGISLVDLPDYLEWPKGAIHSACWFWKNNKLNLYADALDFTAMTYKICGSIDTLNKRIDVFNQIMDILYEE